MRFPVLFSMLHFPSWETLLQFVLFTYNVYYYWFLFLYVSHKMSTFVNGVETSLV